MKIDHIDIDKKNKILVYSLNVEPKILLMAGVHGNEKTGVVILKKIVKQLKNSDKNYPVAIIPCVNLPAYRANSRVHPKDKVDLNRIFPVVKVKSQSYQVAKAIQDFAQKFIIIIDLHVFIEQDTLMCGIDLNITKGKINRKIKKIMSQIGMEAICRIDHVVEPKKNGSLCAYLQKENKLAFGIELPPLEVLTEKDSQKIVKGLIALLRGFSKLIKLKKLNSYKRLQFFSEYAGIFSPQKFPGVEVKKGDILGILREQSGKTQIINSPFAGKLISISYKKFIKKGDKIFVVGKHVKN